MQRISSRQWWWVFGLLIALPALILAILGLRAIRAERIERDDLLRRQQSSVARQVDQAIVELTGRLAGGPNGSSELRFDRRGLLVVPSDRLYFGEYGLRPAGLTAQNDWSFSVRLAIEQAQAAEAQQLSQQAADLYQQVARAEPTLRDWADFSTTRIREGTGVDAALRGSNISESEYVMGLTPTGLPVAVMAGLDVANFAAEDRRPYLPMLKRVLGDLHEGAWWLSASERRFFGEELRDVILDIDPSSRPPADARLEELARIDRAVRQSPPTRTDEITRSFVRLEGVAYLIIWSPDEGSDAWIGITVSGKALRQQLDAELAKLLGEQPFEAEVRDAEGTVVSGGIHGETEIWHTVGSREMPDWEFAFTGPMSAGLLRAQILWYALIGLVLIVLTAGIVMTVRVVRREMELGRLQEELVAAVSHEFKSPITGVRLITERLEAGRSLTAEQRASYFGIIRQELNRLERLVNRLLGTQRVQSEGLQASSVPTMPSELAHEAVGLLKPQAEEKGIRILIDADEDLNRVTVDRPAVVHALENLLDNAIKYSPSESTVNVTIREQGGSARIEVTDRGIGIEGDEQKRIFEKFYRVPTTKEFEVRGTGLGLALAKAVAEAHGGSLELESKPGAGSTFSLVLPITQTEMDHGKDSHRG